MCNKHKVISTAEVVSILYNNGDHDIDKLIIKNNGVFINIDGAKRWIFADQSVIIIDETLTASFISIDDSEEVETKAETTNKKQSWFKRLIMEKKAIGITVASGIIIAASSAVGAIYFNKS